MSVQAIQKLERLLERVQARREGPREVHASQPIELEAPHSSAVPNVPVRMPAPALAGPPASSPAASSPIADRVSRSPMSTPLEDAMGQLAPAPSIPSAPVPAIAKPVAPVAPAPAADDDLILDDFDDPLDMPTAAPPAMPASAVAKAAAPATAPQAAPVPSFMAPAAPVVAPAPIEDLAPMRIAKEAVEGGSPVQVVSSARAASPKTFGALLERSLALRPRR